jgi:dTDP-4-dehydrorhamnose 3,5-epimerase
MKTGSNLDRMGAFSLFPGEISSYLGGVRRETFKETGRMEGVVVTRPAVHEDERGSLVEFFRSDELPGGLLPAMGYISYTRPGMCRGPHEHAGQHDIFFFPGPGRFMLVLWDARPHSGTRGYRLVVEAGEGDPAVVIVPPGVVHAYACISSCTGMVINVPDRLYRGEGKTGPADEIRHEDDDSSPFMSDFMELFKARPH